MRTTLELDSDVVENAKRLARQQGVTLGHVISDLARRSLASAAPAAVRNGVLLLTPKPYTSKPDLTLVNQLRDEA